MLWTMYLATLLAGMMINLSDASSPRAGNATVAAFKGFLEPLDGYIQVGRALEEQLERSREQTVSLESVEQHLKDMKHLYNDISVRLSPPLEELSSPEEFVLARESMIQIQNFLEDISGALLTMARRGIEGAKSKSPPSDLIALLFKAITQAEFVKQRVAFLLDHLAMLLAERQLGSQLVGHAEKEESQSPPDGDYADALYYGLDMAKELQEALAQLGILGWLAKRAKNSDTRLDMAYGALSSQLELVLEDVQQLWGAIQRIPLKAPALEAFPSLSVKQAEIFYLFLDASRMIVTPILHMTQLLRRETTKCKLFHQALGELLATAAAILSHPVWAAPRPVRGYHRTAQEVALTRDPSPHLYSAQKISRDIVELSRLLEESDRDSVALSLMENVLRGLQNYGIEYVAGYDTDPSLCILARDAISLYQIKASTSQPPQDTLQLLARTVKDTFARVPACPASPRLLNIAHLVRSLEVTYSNECAFIKSLQLAAPSHQQLLQSGEPSVEPSAPAKRISRTRSFIRARFRKGTMSAPSSLEPPLCEERLWQIVPQLEERVACQWHDWLIKVRLLSVLAAVEPVEDGVGQVMVWTQFVESFYRRLVSIEAIINQQLGLFLETKSDKMKGLEYFVTLKPLSISLKILLNELAQCAHPQWASVQEVQRTDPPTYTIPEA